MAWGVDYGGTSIPLKNSGYSSNLPDIYTKSGTMIYQLQYGVGGGYENETFRARIRSDGTLHAYNMVIRMPSGSTAYSGVISDMNWNNALFLTIEASTGVSNQTFYLHVYRIIPGGSRSEIYKTQIFTRNNADKCVGLSGDCILFVQPRLFYKDTGLNVGWYLTYIDYTFFYNDDRHIQFFRQYLGNNLNEYNPSFWESTLDWLNGGSGFGSSGLGLYTTYEGEYQGYQYNSINSFTPNQHYQLLTGAYLTDDSLLKEAIIGALDNSGQSLSGGESPRIEMTLYQWLNSKGIETTVLDKNGNTSPGGQSSYSSGNYYSQCASFVDIGCWIAGAGEKLSDSLTNLGASAVQSVKDSLIGSIGYDLSWSGSMNTCYTSSGGTFSGGILEKVNTIVSLLNPIPPNVGDTICIVGGTWTVKYSQLIPEHNFWEIYGNDQTPAVLKTNGNLVSGLNLIDIITIITFVIMIINYDGFGSVGGGALSQAYTRVQDSIHNIRNKGSRQS